VVARVQLDDDAVLDAAQRIFDHGYGVTALSVAYELGAVDDDGRPDAPSVEERLRALADAGHLQRVQIPTEWIGEPEGRLEIHDYFLPRPRTSG
jgi:hypothetical protein